MPNIALAQQYQQHKNHLFCKNWYVACSGGRDSMALVFACVQLFKDGILPRLPAVIHVNHRLQTGADGWANRVQDFCAMHGLTCHIAVLSLAKMDENSARKARYAAIFSYMQDGDILLLGHHADDQAETMLYRLFNGAGVFGLSAMQSYQVRTLPDKTIGLFRPLLSLTRAQISQYAQVHNLPYIDDPTNEAGDNVRAVLRRQIMPILHALNPKATENIARSAFLCQNASAVIHQHAATQYAFCLDDNQSQAPYFSVLHIDRLPADEASAQLVLRFFVQGESAYPPSLAMINRILVLCMRTDNDHQTQLFWAEIDKTQSDVQRWVFVRYRNFLYRYRLDVWRWLHAPSDVFWMRVHAPDFFDEMPKPVILTKKQRQKLAIPPWLSGCVWQGMRQNRRYWITLGRFLEKNKSKDAPDDLPKLAICANLR